MACVWTMHGHTPAAARRTIISIAHRLYTLRDLDRILVLDSAGTSSLVEDGSYPSLVERQGHFYQFLAASGELDGAARRLA